MPSTAQLAEARAQARQIESTVQAIANKIAHDDFRVASHEFVLRIFPESKFGRGVFVQRGNITRVYFAVSIFDPEFEFMLRRAIKCVADMRDTRHSAITRIGDIKLSPAIARELSNEYRAMYGLPPILDVRDCKVTVEYIVRVEHPATKCSVEVRGPVSQSYQGLREVRGLSYKARELLTEQVTQAKANNAPA